MIAIDHFIEKFLLPRSRYSEWQGNRSAWRDIGRECYRASMDLELKTLPTQTALSSLRRESAESPMSMRRSAFGKGSDFTLAKQIPSRVRLAETTACSMGAVSSARAVGLSFTSCAGRRRTTCLALI